MSSNIDNEAESRSTVGVFWAAREFWWLVVALLVVGVGVGLGVSSLQDTRYEASARVLLSQNNSNDEDAVRNPERRLLNEVERMRSPEVTELAIGVLDDGTTAQELRSALKVSGAPDLDLIRVRISHASAETAAAWTNAVVEGYQEAVIVAGKAEIQGELDEKSAYQSQLEGQIAAADAELVEMRSEAEDVARSIYRYAPDIRADVELRLASNTRYNQLTAQIEADQVSLATTRTEIAAARNRQSLVTSGVDTVEPAKVPSSPVQPKPARNAALGGVAGLLLGLALAWWRADALAPVDGRQAAQVLGVTQFGVLPPRRSMVGSRSIDLSPTSPLASAGRVVATALAHRTRGSQSTTILVSSVWRGEGRTLATLTTGLAMARSGRPVLLIDGDSEGRGLSVACHADGAAGITELDSGTRSVDDVLHRLPYPDVASAWLVGAGSADLTGAPRIPEALRRVVRRMDFVLIDGPPLLTSPDAIEMATDVDGVLLVVTEDTSTADLEDARQRLELVDAELLGFILNPVHGTGFSPPEVEDMRQLGQIPIAALPATAATRARVSRHRDTELDRDGDGRDHRYDDRRDNRERTERVRDRRPDDEPTFRDRDDRGRDDRDRDDRGRDSRDEDGHANGDGARRPARSLPQFRVDLD